MTGLILALLCATPAIPALTGPVVDEAGLLDAAPRARLEALSRAARAENGGQGVQLQILTVPSLSDEPLEDFSIRVAEAWKIGTQGKDNGLLLVVARAEHKFRLEVGGGLEGDLTDIQSQHILDQILTPAFRRGDYGGGLYAASVAALAAVHGLPQSVAQSSPPPAARGGGVPVGIVALLLWFFLRHGGWLLFLLFFLAFRNRRRGWSSGWTSSSSSGWSSGGGSSGGGWSGGGGGFSGGGASGGW